MRARLAVPMFTLAAMTGLLSTSLPGCGARDTIVLVVVEGEVPGLRRLEVRVRAAGETRSLSIPEEPTTIPLPTSFSLQFDREVTGAIEVEVDGTEASGRVLASGTARIDDVEVGARNELTISLGRPPTDGGADTEMDGGVDAGAEGTVDAGAEGSVEAAPEAEVDADVELPPDVADESGADSDPDVDVDAPEVGDPDTGPDLEMDAPDAPVDTETDGSAEGAAPDEDEAGSEAGADGADASSDGDDASSDVDLDGAGG